MCETDEPRAGKMRRMESVLWSAAVLVAVVMLDPALRRGCRLCVCVCVGLNKVIADTGAPIAVAVTAANRHEI